MPHEHESPLDAVVDAVEKVTHAVEKGSESEPPPSGKSAKMVKLKAWASVITSMAALVASLGAFLKACDHTLTQNAYNTLSDNITKLSDEQQKNHEDLLSLRGYLDGLSRSPLGPAPTPSLPPEVDAGSPPHMAPNAWTKSGHPTPAVAASALASMMTQEDGGLITFSVIDSAPVPSVHPATAPVKPPSFASVEAK
jgi:hypothetical protein